MLRINARHSDFRPKLDGLRKRLSPDGAVVSERSKEKTIEVFGELLAPASIVDRICQDVRTEGASAVLRYSRLFDGFVPEAQTVRVPETNLREAHRQASPAFLDAIRRIRSNIERFQQAILSNDVAITSDLGGRLELRHEPLSRVGVCVPGGAAAYPSTILMTVVPAMVAGVKEIALVAPPSRFGAWNADVQTVCCELGITELYAVGGAQAVAALAYGTSDIAPVDKIVGPGNLFVALAKKHVFGTVDIDSFAGPSEVVIIADDRAHPALVAADVLAQAEHAPGASIVISWSEELLQHVEIELEKQIRRLDRADLITHSLQSFGAVVLTHDVEQACQISNLLAPEHLEVQCENPRQLLGKLRCAGAIFLGPFSPVAIGDYAAGPSHVLPTGGTGRWGSGLNVNHFRRTYSVIDFTAKELTSIADAAVEIALREELTAHAQSIRIRSEHLENGGR